MAWGRYGTSAIINRHCHAICVSPIGIGFRQINELLRNFSLVSLRYISAQESTSELHRDPFDRIP